MSSINEKLTRIDNSISGLKSALGISQEAQIETIEEKINPEKGLLITEWNEAGYPIKIAIRGLSEIPSYFLSSSGDSFFSKVEDIELPGELTSINSYAFSGCQNLNLQEISKTCTSFGSYAFKDCVNLKLKELPNITSIPAGLFQNCSSLEIEYIPETITHINSYAFVGSGIKIKTFPDSITYITERCFQNCNNITQLSMNNVRTIGGTAQGNPAFLNCKNLQAVWLGKSFNGGSIFINGIGYISGAAYAFTGCDKIKKIFVDRPRAEVEKIEGYNYGWRNRTDGYKYVVCNDDEGFISKEEFDAVDWSSVE